MKKIHEPVLLREVLASLKVKPGAKYIDATVGAGGHAKAILAAQGQVLGVDLDREMLKAAEKRLKGLGARLVLGNFRDLDEIVSDFGPVEGVLIDLGVASWHFDKAVRGFSFKDPQAKLDMRLDPEKQKVTAADLLNSLRNDQLVVLFEPVLGQKQAVELARDIVKAREKEPFVNVGQLLKLFHQEKSRIHPATKAMLALRMAVNSELENLVAVLPKAFKLLKPRGRLVVISFHSLEDRIVKKCFQALEQKKLGQMITKKPIVPSLKEVKSNPRSRSAKLRVFEKNKNDKKKIKSKTD